MTLYIFRNVDDKFYLVVELKKDADGIRIVELELHQTRHGILESEEEEDVQIFYQEEEEEW